MERLMAKARDPEATAIQALIRGASPSMLAEARQRIDAVVEQSGTLQAAAACLGVAPNTLGAWRRVARGESKPPRLDPTPLGRQVMAAVANGDRTAARALMAEAISNGYEKARWNLGVSQRQLKRWVEALDLDVPKGRRLRSGAAEELRVRLFSTVTGVSEIAVEDLEDILYRAPNTKAAAEEIGVTYRTLLDWIKRFGVDPSRAAGRLSLEDEPTELVNP
jgi:transposase-like protein